MATKAEVTEYINAQYGEDEAGKQTSMHEYWFGHQDGARAAVVQEWMSPEIAKILEKLLGDAEMVGRLAKNGSNT